MVPAFWKRKKPTSGWAGKSSKKRKDKLPKPYSIDYYIEEVVRYRTRYESGYGCKDGYPPVVPELLLSILIGTHYIFRALCLALGLGFYFLFKFFLMKL